MQQPPAISFNTTLVIVTVAQLVIILIAIPAGVIVAMNILVIPLHEAGHALAGWLFGYDVKTIILGAGDEVTRLTMGGVRLIIGNSWGGQVQYNVSDEDYFHPTMALVILAGPVAPMLAGAWLMRCYWGSLHPAMPFMVLGLNLGFMFSALENLIFTLNQTMSDAFQLYLVTAENMPDTHYYDWITWGYHAVVLTIVAAFGTVALAYTVSVIKAKSAQLEHFSTYPATA